jgi:hypothetical protein
MGFLQYSTSFSPKPSWAWVESEVLVNVLTLDISTSAVKMSVLYQCYQMTENQQLQ